MTALPDVLRRALAGPLPGLDAQLRMAPRWRASSDRGVALEDLRPAAALLLVYLHEGAWHLPLTVRAARLRHHTGQVSLPGGRIDPGESVEEAALRETHEEVGVEPSAVQVLGRLTPLPVVVSGHLLHPVVGLMPQRPLFRLAADEVERLIEVPLAWLQRPDAVGYEERRLVPPTDRLTEVPYFGVEDVRVWGATAMVLAEFLAIVGER